LNDLRNSNIDGWIWHGRREDCTSHPPRKSAAGCTEWLHP